MNDKNGNRIGAVLALVSLFGFLGVFAFICFGEVKAANKDFFNIALMALIGWIGIAIGYYLGTSTSSAKKSEAIAKLTTPPANASVKTNTETKGVENEKTDSAAADPAVPAT